jgi:hypothetical protein
LLKNAYLAGGTALALQIGHRVSLDFDFFTKKRFDETILLPKLASLPVDFRLERSAKETILGYVNKTRFSLFFYFYPLLDKLQEFIGIRVAGIKDIAPMKIAAISDRGTKRDFIDLYFIIAVEKLYSLEEILGFYEEKFALLHQNKFHLLKSLTYFEDAEKDRLPKMIKKVEWPKVRKFFEAEVKKLSRNRFL